MFNSIGTNEFIVILLIVVFLIGTKKIPNLFKSLGEAVKEFKKAAKDTELKE